MQRDWLCRSKKKYILRRWGLFTSFDRYWAKSLFGKNCQQYAKTEWLGGGRKVRFTKYTILFEFEIFKRHWTCHGRASHKNGIDSVEKPCIVSKLRLRKAWGGIKGEMMWGRLREEWVPDPATEKSSVPHSHVLPPEYRDYTGAFSVAHRLLQRAAARLRDYGFAAESILGSE